VVHPSIWSCHLVTNPEKCRQFPGSGSPSFTIAPVQAMMAGCSRMVAPMGLKLKVVGPPLTLCCW
jgi:hypothetical protein